MGLMRDISTEMTIITAIFKSYIQGPCTVKTVTLKAVGDYDYKCKYGTGPCSEERCVIGHVMTQEEHRKYWDMSTSWEGLNSLKTFSRFSLYEDLLLDLQVAHDNTLIEEGKEKFLDKAFEILDNWDDYWKEIGYGNLPTMRSLLENTLKCVS